MTDKVNKKKNQQGGGTHERVEQLGESGLTSFALFGQHDGVLEHRTPVILILIGRLGHVTVRSSGSHRKKRQKKAQ